MEKEKYKYIIVVLLYRNMQDVMGLIDSVKREIKSKHKIILVNSFFDEKTRNEAERISQIYDCDFVNVENKGYSYGNNTGIKLASEKYEFEYLIVANPDTIIKKFEDKFFDKSSKAEIYAPKIRANRGKRQNPNWVFESEFLEYVQYIGCKNGKNSLNYFVIIILKLARIIFNIISDMCAKEKWKIYSAHGSFVVFSEAAVKALYPVYDDSMFLFHEEVYLANKAKRLNVPTYYISEIEIEHKEDGSIKMCNENMQKISHNSVVIYYESKQGNN